MEDLDDQITWGKPSKKGKTKKNQEAIQQQRAIRGKVDVCFFYEMKLNFFFFLAHNKINEILENCWFCYNSPKIDKSLRIAMGDHTYLALPKRGRLAPGHSLIVPMEHVLAANSFDENVTNEVLVYIKKKDFSDLLEEILLTHFIQKFKTSLVEMFKHQKRDVIFFEVAMNFKKQRHTFIECVPLSQELGQEAPIYFKVQKKKKSD